MADIMPDPNDMKITAYEDIKKPKTLNLVKKTPRFNIEKVQSPTPNTQYQPDYSNQNSATCDAETIGYATHEAVPLTMFYRNENTTPGKSKARPTLAELQKGFDELDEQEVSFFSLLFSYFFITLCILPEKH